jgi:RNA polymerase sigma-70 factor (ECF subfamily)
MTSDATPYIPSGFRGVEHARESGGEELRPHEAQPPFGTNRDQSPECATAYTDGQSMKANCSDESLLEQLREGSHSALALLFRRYAGMVRAVAYRILRDWAEAEDLLQEVFLFIFSKWALFDAGRGSARSWIVQVTYHRAIDRRRHLASRRFYSSVEIDETLLTIEEPISDATFYERSIEGSLGTEMLGKIEDALSSDQRKTMQLYFFEGYTFDEIAERIGQTVGNVRNHYYRGLEKIRKLVFTPELREK